MIAGIFLLGQKGNKNELNFPKTALYSFLYLLYTKEEKKNETQKRKRGQKGKESATEEDARMMIAPFSFR